MTTTQFGFWHCMARLALVAVLAIVLTPKASAQWEWQVEPKITDREPGICLIELPRCTKLTQFDFASQRAVLFRIGEKNEKYYTHSYIAPGRMAVHIIEKCDRTPSK